MIEVKIRVERESFPTFQVSVRIKAPNVEIIFANFSKQTKRLGNSSHDTLAISSPWGPFSPKLVSYRGPSDDWSGGGEVRDSILPQFRVERRKSWLQFLSGTNRRKPGAFTYPPISFFWS